MSFPDGWEWLDEIPSGWSPSSELLTPTGIIRVDLPIRMLSSNKLGNDLIELVGQLLSESARFSIWFGSKAKEQVSSPKQLAMLSLTTNEQHRHVYEAWASYIDAHEAYSGKVESFKDEEESLRRALSDAINNLAVTRSSFQGSDY
ncbi:hypothetical protein ACIQ7D_36425 [Streptomyces sp. NPDC096310]|uniref:hypothetical protein n=1 Tax=Streptomyces sp. NPDC096310 TaxID=3366082 RepID=UPI0038295629